MVIIKLPIIVDDHGDILVFQSVEKAERFLEPIDVANKDVVAYDSAGRLLEFSVEAGTWSDRVVLGFVEEVPGHTSELHQALVRFLSQLEVSDEWLAKAPLDDLVNRAVKEYKLHGYNKLSFTKT